jgi:hypothetical protein
MLFVKTRWSIGLILMALLIAGVEFWRASNLPYTVEIRRVAADGTVSYEPQRYEEWNHEANIAGLRRHTRDTIYHSVYADGLQYCFSRSGRVYAMQGAENDLPSFFVHEWTWSGDPHGFPYYSYPHIAGYDSP